MARPPTDDERDDAAPAGTSEDAASDAPRADLLDERRRAGIDRAREPPVVARMVIEIRSDGSHTIARGALEDVASGENVSVEARGTSPAALAGSLIRSLFSGPNLARIALRALLPPPRPRAPTPRRREPPKR